MATADVACNFQEECLEGEACAATDYDLTVSAGGAVNDPSGSYEATTLADRAWAWDAGWGLMLLSVGSDGRGRLSVHMPDDGMSIFYLGTCDEAAG